MATVFLVTGPLGDDLLQIKKLACRTPKGADRVVEELVKQHVEHIADMCYPKDGGLDWAYRLVDGYHFDKVVERVELPGGYTYKLKPSCIDEARELLEECGCTITVEEIRYEDNNVMRCKAETCSNLFVRVRRQLYCSKSCSQKVRSKVWYARHGEEKRRKNREAYRKVHHA